MHTELYAGDEWVIRFDTGVRAHVTIVDTEPNPPDDLLDHPIKCRFHNTEHSGMKLCVPQEVFYRLKSGNSSESHSSRKTSQYKVTQTLN